MFKKYRIGIVILLALILLSYKLNKPFIGHHDWNGAFWGTITRNYLGNIQKFINPHHQEIDHISPSSVTYFVDYTPMLPLLFTLSALFLGLSELSMRLATVLFSLLMLLYIYKIGKLMFNEHIGLIASLCALLTPMFLYFGKLPDHEPIVTSLITVAVYYYLKLLKDPAHTTRPFLVWIFLALSESWVAFFWVPAFIIHRQFVTRQKNFPGKKIVVLALGVILTHLALIYYFVGNVGLRMFLVSGISRLNASSASGDIIHYTFKDFLRTEAHYSVIYFTRVLLIFAGVWLVRLIFLWKSRIVFKKESLLLLLLFPGLGFLIAFNKLTFIHDYKLYVLLPFIALAAARTIYMLLTFIENVLKNRSKLLKTISISVAFILVMCGIGTERLPYLKTLLNTSFNSPGYKLGLLLSQKIPPGEVSFINSSDMMSFYDVFVRYYSNRKIAGGDVTLDMLSKNPQVFADYRYVVFIDGRTKDRVLQQYLENKYRYDKYSGVSVVDLKN